MGSAYLVQTASLSIAYPGSFAIYNTFIAGGMCLSQAIILYHASSMIEKAKKDEKFDPLS